MGLQGYTRVYMQGIKGYKGVYMQGIQGYSGVYRGLGQAKLAGNSPNSNSQETLLPSTLTRWKRFKTASNTVKQ